MTRLIAALFLLSTVAVGSASAQPFTPNGDGVTMGHWHLNSRRCRGPEEDVRRHGRPAAGPPGDLQRVVFPGVVVILNLRAPAAPPTGGIERLGREPRWLHRSERAGSDCQVEGGRRTGATGRQRSAGSGLGHDARMVCASKSWRTRTRSSQSSTSTCTSSCRKP